MENQIEEKIPEPAEKAIGQENENVERQNSVNSEIVARATPDGSIEVMDLEAYKCMVNSMLEDVSEKFVGQLRSELEAFAAPLEKAYLKGRNDVIEEGWNNIGKQQPKPLSFSDTIHRRKSVWE
ncbi:MAG: hypothetical protein NC201_07920 [Prevotella sp.]|nr:hypothetical protein [Bacteroides sp.]MCM1367155.1 hypothetical protein [Prevotella sp.]